MEAGLRKFRRRSVAASVDKLQCFLLMAAIVSAGKVFASTLQAALDITLRRIDYKRGLMCNKIT